MTYFEPAAQSRDNDAPQEGVQFFSLLSEKSVAREHARRAKLLSRGNPRGAVLRAVFWKTPARTMRARPARHGEAQFCCRSSAPPFRQSWEFDQLARSRRYRFEGRKCANFRMFFRMAENPPQTAFHAFEPSLCRWDGFASVTVSIQTDFLLHVYCAATNERAWFRLAGVAYRRNAHSCDFVSSVAPLMREYIVRTHIICAFSFFELDSPQRKPILNYC